jgi:hypothetical protein
MRTLLEILGLRTPERGREPVALPRSLRWMLPLLIVASAVLGALVARFAGSLVWSLAT